MNNKVCNPKEIVSQLHRIEGQVRSLEKMYNKKRDIEEIVRVVLAARASLDSVTKLLINDKVSGCFDNKEVNSKEELKELISIFFKTT